MADLEIRGLTKIFPGGMRALDGLDLQIKDGEFFALLGPSGCGKTTLLRSIAGLEMPNSGQILIGGRDVTRLPPAARDVAMVFQDYALYPHMTVAENIAYPLKVRRVGRKERREAAESVGRSLQIQGAMLDRRPGQLSGGQQQRVALARAIAYHGWGGNSLMYNTDDFSGVESWDVVFDPAKMASYSGKVTAYDSAHPPSPTGWRSWTRAASASSTRPRTASSDRPTHSWPPSSGRRP